MFLAGVGEVRKRGFAPGGQECCALRRGRLDGAGEPVVKGSGLFAGFGAEVGAEIVEAHAAGDDEHAFVAQRREGASSGEMERRIERAGQ